MTEHQPSLFDALAARDEAMARVAGNAEESCPDFAAQSRAFVLGYLASHGPAPGEAVTNACKAAGVRPHDDRAFGPVLYALARAGLIRKAGACVRAKGHGCSGGNIWELVVTEPPA
jgi:hypothetical protein